MQSALRYLEPTMLATSMRSDEAKTGHFAVGGALLSSASLEGLEYGCSLSSELLEPTLILYSFNSERSEAIITYY